MKPCEPYLINRSDGKKKGGARDHVWLTDLVRAPRTLTAVALLPRPITGTSPSNAELSQLHKHVWAYPPSISEITDRVTHAHTRRLGHCLVPSIEKRQRWFLSARASH